MKRNWQNGFEMAKLVVALVTGGFTDVKGEMVVGINVKK